VTFADPVWLLLLLAIPIVMWWGTISRRRRRLAYPATKAFAAVAGRGLARWRFLPAAARAIALACIVVALARPQLTKGPGVRDTEGLDIVLVVDTSRSMEARDFVLSGQRPTRLAVVKRVIADFIKTRSSDRIGMVIFGTEAFTQAPLTLDHEVLQKFLDRVTISMAGDATAIGDGVATAVSRLKDIDAKSKVVILLTDGENTAGRIDPLAATKAAKSLGVKVYTIGIGTAVAGDGKGKGPQKLEIDTDLLSRMAQETGGKSFIATDTETLVRVYDTIDELEKTRVSVDSFTEKEERYRFAVWPALALLVFEWGLALTRLRSIP
jgi:Ca-activated chloride channel family protein